MSEKDYPRSLCEGDVVFFINTFCRLRDPRRGLGGFPFEMSDKQSDFAITLDSAIGRRDLGVIKRGRNVGATRISGAVLLRKWLFQKEKSFLILGRTLRQVELESRDSFLDRFDFMLSELPNWLKPDCVRKEQCFFHNEDTNSLLFCGSVTGGDLGGERLSSVFFDDFDPSSGNSEKAFQRAQFSTNSRITISQAEANFVL